MAEHSKAVPPRQDTALPSPASVLSAAGVFARFALFLRQPRRWQNIPRPHPTPSGHGAPIARLGFVRSGRFCAVRAVPAPAAPMTEHSQSRTHSVRTRRSHRPLRFYPQQAFLRGSRYPCAGRADGRTFQSRTRSVRTRRSHRPPRFYPQRAFLRGSRCSCASRADDGASQSRPAPSGHGASARGRPLRHEFRRGRLSSLPTPPSPFHVSTGNAACPEALCR